MPRIPEIFGVCLSLRISDVFCICYNPWTRGGESGLVAGLDFKSSGIHRKVGSVGSIPMHLRHENLQRFPTPRTNRNKQAGHRDYASHGAISLYVSCQKAPRRCPARPRTDGAVWSLVDQEGQPERGTVDELDSERSRRFRRVRFNRPSWTGGGPIALCFGTRVQRYQGF